MLATDIRKSSSHLRKIKDQKIKTAHFLGKVNQKELIQILTNDIKNKISCKLSKIFFDYFRLYSRYQSYRANDNNNAFCCKNKRTFLRFVRLEKATGALLTRNIT